ncbi:MAG: tripartite tricarboxylate transporter substrate binding protein [Rhodomicrobiaceae bacterium]
MSPYRRACLACLAAAMLLGLTGSLAAYPVKPIEYIIPFSPGGESDITARLQQPFFKEKFAEDLNISYMPGRGGATSWSKLNELPADGYTIMGVNLPHIVLQPLGRNVEYKTEDLTTIYWFHFTPDAIVVKADSQFKTLQDLIDYASKNAGKLSFSGSGRASANHLAQVRFNKLTGIETSYVPFKGSGASLTALIGEQVNAAWGYTTSAVEFGDKLRLLAVATEERHPNYPDTPTFRELGIDLVSGAYRGIAVPAATPESVRQNLSDMIGQINADPDFQTRMLASGFALVNIPYEESASFVNNLAAKYIAAAEEAGIIAVEAP